MASTAALQADPLPLVEDGAGGYRVGNTRISLELVLEAFDAGQSPEQVATTYEVLELADLYALKAHYLRHLDWAREYLRWAQQAASEAADRVNALPTSSDGFREQLLAKKDTSKPS